MDVDRYEMLRQPHEDRWGMLVGADDPLAALPSVTPADVRSARLIVPHRAGARSELAAWMGVDASPGSGLAFVPLEPPRAAGVCPRKRLPGAGYSLRASPPRVCRTTSKRSSFASSFGAMPAFCFAMAIWSITVSTPSRSGSSSPRLKPRVTMTP